MILFFSTPAWGRYEMSAICFEQRADAIKKLEAAGIEAHCVVVTDDDNDEIARQFDFSVVYRDNEYLGRRFNDGYEYAVAAGATHVFPIGSDSWCDPQFIIDAIEKHGEEQLMDSAICSRNYAMVDATGQRGKRLWVPVQQGVSFVFPVSALKLVEGRPCGEQLKRGCDGSAWQSINRAVSAATENGDDLPIVWSEAHAYETVRFESWPQVSSHDNLGVKWGVPDSETGTMTETFSPIFSYYPEELVDKMTGFYARNADATIEARNNSVANEQVVNAIVHRAMEEAKVPTLIRKETKPVVELAVRMALER